MTKEENCKQFRHSGFGLRASRVLGYSGFVIPEPGSQTTVQDFLLFGLGFAFGEGARRAPKGSSRSSN